MMWLAFFQYLAVTSMKISILIVQIFISFHPKTKITQHFHSLLQEPGTIAYVKIISNLKYEYNMSAGRLRHVCSNSKPNGNLVELNVTVFQSWALCIKRW
uniref:Uncharacterized protein n=1 Tax=Cacopsylla melanoneura TaxID=428564 RepID=A0A8D8XNH2_9HEMI